MMQSGDRTYRSDDIPTEGGFRPSGFLMDLFGFPADKLRVPVFVFDGQGLVYHNPEALRPQYGFADHDTGQAGLQDLARNIFSLVPFEEIKQGFQQRRLSRADTHTVFTADSFWDTTGDKALCFLILYPVPAVNGDALQNALEEIKARDFFISRLSHEYRTPLNAILGFTELLLEDAEDNFTRDYLMAILKGGEGLLHLVNEVLEYSRIGAGKFVGNTEPVRMDFFVAEIGVFFQPEARRRDLRLDVSVDPAIPAIIVCDATHLRQALYNLLSNALKYTQEGFISLRVSLLAKHESTVDLRFDVEDSGLGLPEEFRKKIFGMFEKGRANGLSESAGLGLAITRRLVEAIGGRLDYESTDGHGSRFHIVLEGLPYVGDAGNGKVIDGLVPDIYGRILLVDELPVTRALLREMFVPGQTDVLEAESLQEARKLLGDVQPDLVILGLNPLKLAAPRETLQLIKQSGLIQCRPIIGVLPYGEKRAEILSFFDAVLYHPITTETLGEVLRQLFQEAGMSSSAKPEGRLTDRPVGISQLTPLQCDSLKKLWQQYVHPVKGIIEPEKTRQFAHKLMHWGMHHKNENVSTFGMELLRGLDSFDLERIETVLANLNSLINK